MNPELPSPHPSPEQAPSVGGQEYGQFLPSPEMFGERSPEREQSIQQGDRGAELPPPPPPVVVPMPVSLPVPAPQPAVSADDNPILASDDDLIEKEWVDKAKSIITQTQNDPYRRELEIGKLQADYLLKRYGRVLGSPQ